MKAAVVYHLKDGPKYTDFPEPVISEDDECLMTVKAAAIKHLDKSRAAGKHYSSETQTEPRIIGGDGVGVLPDGRKVFGLGKSGTVAEKALVRKNSIIAVPEGLDDAIAAALPNAVAGSAMALLFRGKLKRGDTVLINGATGFTGKTAIQVAKYYGAGKIIVTGRNEKALQRLPGFGADEVISLNQKEEDFIRHLSSIHNVTPVDIVIDYLWGKAAEMILLSLKSRGEYFHCTRFVSVGSIAGETISLSSQILRSADFHICGSGIGSWSREEMNQLFKKIIPEVFQLAVEGKMQADIVKAKPADIETLWQANIERGSRLVVMIN